MPILKTNYPDDNQSVKKIDLLTILLRWCANFVSLKIQTLYPILLDEKKALS